MDYTNTNHAIIIGCGYVGTALAKTWVSQGITVTATTTTPERIPELEAIANRATVLRADDANALRNALVGQDTAVLTVGAPNRDAYEQTYLNTAKSMAAVLRDTPVQQVIYTGSCAVYGDQNGAWVDEETAIAPLFPRHQIMADAERMLLDADTNQQHICILRLGGIYGPGRELSRIFSRAAGKTRPGDGAEPSNWTHLDDIVGAIAFARTHCLRGLYNLVQDDPPSRRDLIDWVCQTHNLPPVQWNPASPSERSYTARVSNQKIKTAGYTLSHPTFPGWLQ